MQKVLLTTLILSSSLMIAMEANKNEAQSVNITDIADNPEEIDRLAHYFGISACVKSTLLSDSSEKIKPNFSFRDGLQDERTEFLIENLQWRVREVLDANGRVKPESMDTAQELLREACCNYQFSNSLQTLLNAGVNPYTEIKGFLPAKELAAQYNIFALWTLEEYDKKGTFKPDTSKE